MKEILWKVKIPFTKYNLQRYTYTSDFERSGIESMLSPQMGPVR
jgi:hypothetical protein